MKASSAIQASETQFLVPLELPGLQGYFGEPVCSDSRTLETSFK